MADDRRWTDLQESPCISDTRTVHSHIHYTLVNTGIVGVVGKLMLEALLGTFAQVSLYP